MMQLFRLAGAVERDPDIEIWLNARAIALGSIARTWFVRMRKCGSDVRELMHDGCPVVCVEDAPFGYVNVFRAHANVGFFYGAELLDPRRLLEGSGKRMRHVKVKPNADLDSGALGALIDAAYADIKKRLDLERFIGRRTSVKKSGSQTRTSPSRLIDARIQELGDWRGKLLSRLRNLVKEADPEVVEEWKWEVPVWSHDGLICTGESYRKVVKLTFARGAALPDPGSLFNSSLEGNTRRAIDLHEGEKIDAQAFKALVRAAVKLNKSKAQS